MALITLENTLTTKAIFSPDKKHRYLLSKRWSDKEENIAAIIMVNPATAADIVLDKTSMLIINHLQELGFTGCDIVNIYSCIASSTKDENKSNPINDKQIVSSARDATKVILGWGSAGENNKRIADRQKEVLKLLKPFKEKLVTIADSKGRSGYHPLAPQIYAKWVLKPFAEKN